jgi:phosphohistidine phosphatase
MKLYLMQHALAQPADKDPERHLSPAGIVQAKSAGRGIKRLGLGIDLIITSSKRRAHQTAALIAEAIRFPYSDIMSSEAILPDRDPKMLLDLIEKETPESRILVVGHQPHLANLASALMQGGILLIENAGLTGFDLAGAPPAKLEFHLQAAQLAHYLESPER